MYYDKIFNIIANIKGGFILANIHRLTWLDKKIRNLSYPNRRTLAEKFEISIRQAQRDIDYLKNSLDAPIKYDGKKRGYYYEDESYILPNIHINDLQKKMLNFLAYRYENYTQTPQVVQMAHLFKKLAGEEKIDDEIPIFDLRKPIVQLYYSIYNSINSKNKLRIGYRCPYKGEINIKLEPYKLFYKSGTDHLVGYDNSIGELNVLRLDRILKLDVLDEFFKVLPNFNEGKYSGFIERDPYVTRIKCNKEWDITNEKRH